MTVLQYSRLTSGICARILVLEGQHRLRSARRDVTCAHNNNLASGVTRTCGRCQLARGPQSVLRHAARFPRPTDSAGLTDNVSEHRGTDGE